MKFKRRNLVIEGFQGFVTVKELRDGKIDQVPHCGGVYFVLRETESPPTFLGKNPGGLFKGKDPTVSKGHLEFNWVDGAHVIYIGKAKDFRLQRRISELIDYGAAKPTGHRGGRLIWQIENSDEFVVAWKCVNKEKHSEDIESDLLEEFRTVYGRLPFANLRRGRKRNIS